MSQQPSAFVVIHQREPFFRGFTSFLRQTWASRTLLVSLVRKDLLVRYRESALGILWSIVKPVIQLLVYGVVVGLFLGMGRTIPNFGLYMFTGLMMMGLFSESVTNGTTSILRGAPVIKKVPFRRELLPLAAVGGALVNMAFQFVALAIGYLVTRTGPNWSSLGFAVPGLLIVVLFGTAAALLLSALNVYMRDVQFIADVGLMVLFWMTPVVYSWTRVQDSLAGAGLPDWLFDLYMLNPITNGLLAFRQAFWPGSTTPQGEALDYFNSPLDPRLWAMVLAGAVSVWLAQRVFNRLQAGFAAEL